MSLSAQIRGSLPALLVLLAILAGAGGWNYHRNWQAELEAQRGRPFGEYDDKSLSQLAKAYRAELEAWKERYEGAQGSRAQLRDARNVEANVEQFARVRANNQNRREVTSEVAQREARLREIAKERKIRARNRRPEAHWRRLTKYP